MHKPKVIHSERLKPLNYSKGNIFQVQGRCRIRFDRPVQYPKGELRNGITKPTE